MNLNIFEGNLSYSSIHNSSIFQWIIGDQNVKFFKVFFFFFAQPNRSVKDRTGKNMLLCKSMELCHSRVPPEALKIISMANGGRN